MSITLTRATKIVPLCLRLDLKAEHERAARELEAARNRAAQDARENGGSDVRDAAAAVQAIEAQMHAHTLLFTLQALPRKAWNEFAAANPPRADHETDKAVDVDVSALDEVLVGVLDAAGRRIPSIISVTSADGAAVPFDPAEGWTELADEMSDSQWTEFATATLALNNGSTTVPFSPAASLAMRRSEQTSKPPSA